MHRVVRRLLANGTTTVAYYGSLHLQPNKVLVDEIVRLGQRAVVGKVRNHGQLYGSLSRLSHPLLLSATGTAAPKSSRVQAEASEPKPSGPPLLAGQHGQGVSGPLCGVFRAGQSSGGLQDRAGVLRSARGARLQGRRVRATQRDGTAVERERVVAAGP